MKSNVKTKPGNNIKMFSTNGAGVVGGKVESLKAEVKHTNCNIITLQETHSRTKGKIQIEEFVVFEAIRREKGGGTMIAAHQNLKPKLVEEYTDSFELLTVEVETKEKEIRIISGYGPQENLPEDKRLPFFVALELEVEKASLAGKSVIIEMDANSKLGNKYIPKDPHEQSQNGAKLAEIVERQQLTVVNGTSMCSGVITRTRKTKERTEQSAIDMVIVSSDMVQNIVKMDIDEDRKHVLTKVTKTKKGVKVKESDHNVIITEFNIVAKETKEKQKLEMYNLKNIECQRKFKNYTTNTKMLSTVFNNETEDIDVVTKRFLKKIDGAIAMSFKKNRVRHRVSDKEESLCTKRTKLKEDTEQNNNTEIDEINKELAEVAQEKFQKLKDEIKGNKKDKVAMNQMKLWKMKKRLCPRARDPPAAILDSKGNLLTNDIAIEERAIEVYKERLKGNKINKHLEHIESLEEDLCKTRLKKCKTNKTEPWSMKDLQLVLKGLKKDKSRDSRGYANELFMLSVAGDDLQLAVLNFMNLIKKKQQFPKLLEDCNITSIHKKGSKKELENYRGIFRVSVLRSILDKLIYNDTNQAIDESLTDGNVGARKERGVRDNIFVLGAITNSVVNGNSAPIQVQVMDIQKCFDKMWLEASINSLYNAGLNNDNLNLLYLENNNANVAVKVNNNLSRRFSVKNVIMQGTVWGSLQCTTQMDELNKIMKQDKTLQYKYKNDPNINIGVLGVVDDTLAISECGNMSVVKNAVVNSFVETRRLTLHTDKSVVVHIGNPKKCKSTCPTLKVHNDIMPVTDATKYIGNQVTSSGTQKSTIEDRRNKGWGKVATIMGILAEVGMGAHRVEAGLLLRKAVLHSSMLFSAEAWSGVGSKEMKRLEQVDTHLLKLLLGGHSKCPSVFYHLETGTLMLRHIVMIHRMMYHHHIITRNDDETIKKIYYKQKEERTKGDWYQLLLEDFDFIGHEIDEEDIKQTPKNIYKKKIKELVKHSAFKLYKEKQTSLKKIRELKYEKLEIKPYLKSEVFTKEERTLLVKLRSQCHDSKSNFRKMNQHSLKCSFGCNAVEDQKHAFTQCQPILSKVSDTNEAQYENIDQDIYKQKSAVKVFLKIDHERRQAKEALLPGGATPGPMLVP